MSTACRSCHLPLLCISTPSTPSPFHILLYHSFVSKQTKKYSSPSSKAWLFMASMEVTSTRDSGKTVPEFGPYAASAPEKPANFFGVDFALRLLLFMSTLAALVVMVTSKQTKLLPTSLQPPLPEYVSRAAKFSHSPAFIYLVAALAVTCFYGIITIMTSAFVISNPSPSTKLLFHLILLDALMAGIMASATGAAGGVAYIGLKGNSHVRWNKICHLYGKYCHHIGAATAVSLIASIILVMLVVLSSYSLYRRSR